MHSYPPSRSPSALQVQPQARAASRTSGASSAKLALSEGEFREYVRRTAAEPL